MASRKLWMVLILITAVTVACQPPRKKGTPINRGRGRISSGNLSAPGATGNAGTVDSGKLWGEVTSNSGDTAFRQELYYLTLPSLKDLGAEDQLGYVSSQSNQSTGVRFFGNAVTTGGSGTTRQFAPDSMKIHVEVYDDLTGQQRSDGSTRAPVVIEISSAHTDTFVSASGTLIGAQVNLYWEDTYGSIQMQGTINGSTFSGTMKYSDNSSGVSGHVLGNFSVPTCGFFQCN